MFDDAYFISLGCDVLERSIAEYKRLLRDSQYANYVDAAKRSLDHDIARFQKDVLIDKNRTTKDLELLKRVEALTSEGIDNAC